MAAKFRNQIVALIRFSYPAENGFAASSGSITETEARLYDPARLEARFRLFEGLTLPSLKAQTDRDFTTILLVGKTLPKTARDRLLDVLEPLPGARVIALPSLPHYTATRRAMNMAELPGHTHLTGFRLDDDDALDIRHVARMRERVATLLPLLGLDRPLVTGCNAGWFLKLDPAGNRLTRVVESWPIGIGLALTTPFGHGETIFRRNHRIATQHYNCFTDAETPAFIRTIHHGNDSDAYATGLSEEVGWDEAAPLIAADFPFTAEGLQRL